jgi:hypothetical protein
MFGWAKHMYEWVKAYVWLWPISELLVLKHFGPARVSFQPKGWPRMEATAAKRV